MSYSDTIVVAAGQTKYVPLRVKELNRITGSFSVEGGNNDVNFWVADPFNNVVVQSKTVTRNQEVALVAATAGEYRLYFDNSYSWVTNKVVKYSVTLYWR